MTTIRQKLLHRVYPLVRKTGTLGKKGTMLMNDKKTAPAVSIYGLTATLNNGKELNFSSLAGKTILLVNTASDCGYTRQYAELQTLYEKFAQKLVIIAFPANDFGEQETGNDKDIAQFCQLNYGVTFPVAKKSIVIKSDDQNNIFKWLTNSKLNGWNNHEPDWNFGKYIIDAKGTLTGYFGPAISPLDDTFIKSLQQ